MIDVTRTTSAAFHGVIKTYYYLCEPPVCRDELIQTEEVCTRLSQLEKFISNTYTHDFHQLILPTHFSWSRIGLEVNMTSTSTSSTHSTIHYVRCMLRDNQTNFSSVPAGKRAAATTTTPPLMLCCCCRMKLVSRSGSLAGERTDKWIRG